MKAFPVYQVTSNSVYGMTCDLTGFPNGALTWTVLDNVLKDIYKNGTLTNSTNLAFSLTMNSTFSTITLTSVSKSSIFVCLSYDPAFHMPYILGLYSVCLSK